MTSRMIKPQMQVIHVLICLPQITVKEWTCRKEFMLSQKYISTLRQSKTSTKKKQVFFKMNSSLGSLSITLLNGHYIGDERVSVPWVVINKTMIKTAVYFP